MLRQQTNDLQNLVFTNVLSREIDPDKPWLSSQNIVGLNIGCFPWKFQGGEAAFARVVAFDGEWPANP
jgi:hypothetical protein